MSTTRQTCPIPETRKPSASKTKVVGILPTGAPVFVQSAPKRIELADGADSGRALEGRPFLQKLKSDEKQENKRQIQKKNIISVLARFALKCCTASDCDQGETFRPLSAGELQGRICQVEPTWLPGQLSVKTTEKFGFQSK